MEYIQIEGDKRKTFVYYICVFVYKQLRILSVSTIGFVTEVQKQCCQLIYLRQYMVTLVALGPKILITFLPLRKCKTWDQLHSYICVKSTTMSSSPLLRCQVCTYFQEV